MPAVECDIAWAAGLFEGEGTFTHSRTRGKYRLAAALAMGDEEVVRHFHRALGFGRVYRVSPPSWHNDGNRNPVQWRWQTGKENEFRRLVELLEPYLSTRRRERAYQLLNELGTLSLEQLRLVPDATG
jgi:hypothetical protein